MHVFLLCYDWLVANNLWKTTVAFFVAAILGYVVGLRRLWRKHRNSQKHIEDLLNTNTPGGLEVIKELLLHLQGEITLTEDDEDPDDNGSDPEQPLHGTRITIHSHGGGK